MIGGRAKTYLKFLGANVHRLRVRLGKSQEELEESSGLDVRFIRRVERGSVNLRFDTFIRLAEGLGVEPGKLLQRSKPLTPKSGRPKARKQPGK
jgi:transcriptional regulator with XRE-family HTH domain